MYINTIETILYYIIETTQTPAYLLISIRFSTSIYCNDIFFHWQKAEKSNSFVFRVIL
jgi:hypothetical protein